MDGPETRAVAVDAPAHGSRSPATILVAGLALWTACTPHPRDAQVTADDAAATPTVTVTLPDTLLLTTPSGYQIWWTLGRNATGADGSTCVERGVLIVKDTVRHLVPLMYTAAPPTVVDGKTIRAVLSNRCAPTTVYRVDLATGDPTPEPGG